MIASSKLIAIAILCTIRLSACDTNSATLYVSDDGSKWTEADDDMWWQTWDGEGNCVVDLSLWSKANEGLRAGWDDDRYMAMLRDARQLMIDSEPEEGGCTHMNWQTYVVDEFPTDGIIDGGQMTKDIEMWQRVVEARR